MGDFMIDRRQDGNRLTIAPFGRIDTYSAIQLSDYLKDIPEEITELVFDLEGVDYVSSAGLRCFSRSDKEMNRRKGKMSVIHVCPAVEDVFNMTGFAALIDIRR